jgi:hypothetical protein
MPLEASSRPGADGRGDRPITSGRRSSSMGTVVLTPPPSMYLWRDADELSLNCTSVVIMFSTGTCQVSTNTNQVLARIATCMRIFIHPLYYLEEGTKMGNTLAPLLFQCSRLN